MHPNFRVQLWNYFLSWIHILHFKYVWNLPSLSLARFFLIQNELRTIWRSWFFQIPRVSLNQECTVLCYFISRSIIFTHLQFLLLTLELCQSIISHANDILKGRYLARERAEFMFWRTRKSVGFFSMSYISTFSYKDSTY